MMARSAFVLAVTMVFALVMAVPSAAPDQAAGAKPCGRPNGPTCPPASPTPGPTGTAQGGIYFGVFEDFGSYWTDPARFDALITDVRAHNLDSIAWTNGWTADYLRAGGLADTADARSFPSLVSQMQANLARDWYPDSVPATIEKAREVIGPLVDALKVHPSTIGYNLKDDATRYYIDKFRLAEQVVRERSTKPSSPMLVRGTEGRDVYAGTLGDVFLFYAYPARKTTTACSWAQTWVDELRLTRSSKPAHVPIWQVLQAHETTDATGVRYPTIEELRLQTWIALGEGAKGLWWFTYTGGSQAWDGLAESPARYAEAASLGARVNSSIEPTLAALRKVADAYSGSELYVSTMTDGTNTYIVPVNKSCSARNVAITGSYSRLVDVETGTVYLPGNLIPFRGGDGHLLRVVS